MAVFYKSVIAGVPLSKVARLTHWDSVFAYLRQGKNGLMDPSLVQLMIPYYLLVARLWHAGQFPLWNDLSGCGIPLLADPQSQVFSPLHAVLSLYPQMSVYNFLLLFELWIGAAGTYLLARSLGIRAMMPVPPHCFILGTACS